MSEIKNKKNVVKITDLLEELATKMSRDEFKKVATRLLEGMNDEEKHWESGLRVHGYWRGMERLGWVSLSPPPKIRGTKRIIYTWCVDCEEIKPITGACLNLKTAKRLVERIVKSREMPSNINDFPCADANYECVER